MPFDLLDVWRDEDGPRYDDLAVDSPVDDPLTAGDDTGDDRPATELMVTVDG